MAVSQKKPALVTLPARDLASMWLPHEPLWISLRILRDSISPTH
ncbi:hypothetical protein A2U01_0100234, partial [Trifolium medium]|nr:hypothetical protein [Trifolium medium]